MLNVALVKSVICIAAGSSAGNLVRQALINNVTPQTNFEIVRNWIGGVAVGSAVAGYIQKDTQETLEQIEVAYKNFKEQKANPEN